MSIVPTAVFAQITDPTDISNLVFWVDGQDINGDGSPPPADGALVSTWVDKSTGGNNLTTTDGTVTYEATGFDGLNPGLRFPLSARMAGANPFAGNFQNEMSVFFVNANLVRTRNMSLSLNGTSTGRNIANGRFLFHTPWINNRVFFDAGACCGITRLDAVNPNPDTETALYTGINDEPGNRQVLRVDGQTIDSDGTGHNASVIGGIHLGDPPPGGPNLSYDGRFAEVVIYDRALTDAEVDSVECYLLAKWKPSVLPSGCAPVFSVTKTVEPFDASGLGAFRVPGNDARYEVTVTKAPSAAADDDSLFIVDTLPENLIFFNDDVDGPGPETNPIGFSQTGTSLTFSFATDVGFSDSVTAPTTFIACNFISTVVGYDPAIRHVCINPKGSLDSSAPTSFSIFFRTRIE